MPWQYQAEHSSKAPRCVAVTQQVDKPLATEFVELPCEVLFADVERVGGECGWLELVVAKLCGLVYTVHAKQ